MYEYNITESALWLPNLGLHSKGETNYYHGEKYTNVRKIDKISRQKILEKKCC